METIEFVPLKNFEDKYEILNQYPHTIRRKDNHQPLNEYTHNDYLQVSLNNTLYMKHRLIAQQFIPNPENLPWVDHINHIRDDNRIENLRWVTSSQNQMNKSSNKGINYVYVDSIPDDAIVVNQYSDHTFENYFFSKEVFYFFTGFQYRALHINTNKIGSKMVNLIDIDGKRVRIYISKFKKMYDLI